MAGLYLLKDARSLSSHDLDESPVTDSSGETTTALSPPAGSIAGSFRPRRAGSSWVFQREPVPVGAVSERCGGRSVGGLVMVGDGW